VALTAVTTKPKFFSLKKGSGGNQMKKLVSFLAMGVALQYSFGTLVGCSADAPGRKASQSVDARGTLSMALQTVSESGKVYRLRNATFFVSTEFFFQDTPIVAFPDAGTIGSAGTSGAGAVFGAGGSFFPPDGGFSSGGFGGGFSDGGFAGGFSSGGGGSTFPNQFFLSSEDDPTAPVIERFLTPGSYDIQLFDGWFVEQVDNLLGTSSPVPATLLSSSFQFFDITSDQETFLKFDFEVDGSRVTFGPPGRLIIGIGIHESQGGAFCGNGIAEEKEDCDSFDLRGATCASVTMGARPNGPLFCTSSCTFDTTFCQGGGGFDGGTGGFGTGGSTGTSGAAGSVGFPGADAGVVGSGAGGVPGKPPSP
jgi:hypothetical protein